MFIIIFLLNIIVKQTVGKLLSYDLKPVTLYNFPENVKVVLTIIPQFLTIVTVSSETIGYSTTLIYNIPSLVTKQRHTKLG